MIIPKKLYTSENKLITYEDCTLTYKSFFEEVYKIVIKFDHFKEIDELVLIDEDNPIKFYVMMFALWQCSKKIVFPNRDFFEGKSFRFVKYIINGNGLHVNDKFTKVDIGSNNYDSILFSSGSTGEPKGIVHHHDTFFTNAKSVMKSLNIVKITSVTPLKPYLISALNHFLVHFLSDSHLIFIDLLKLSSIKNISQNYPSLSYVGSPIHIVSMMRYIENKKPLLFFSSGDIFYPSIIKDIFHRYPDTLFFNVYGMVELGGRLFINRLNNNSSKEEYTNIGKNIDLTEIKVIDEEVHVESKLLFHGYIKENKFHVRKSKYFATGDKVKEVKEVKEFYEFFGRKNDEIKVAGNKVSMKYLEQTISNILPDNIIPIVVNKQHPSFGNLLALVLLSENNIVLDRVDLIKILRKKMQSHELPHHFYITNKVPYTQTMKIDRKEIIKELDSYILLK